MRGKFIVICGTDGSGKGTQVTLLNDRLKQEGFNVKLTDFPQYGMPSAGMVELYLKGKLGSIEEVTPYQASILYATDRFAASKLMHTHLDEGGIIISNRYVSANKGHQLAKITNPEERALFLEWLDHLEYGIFNIPKEDINILLYVPPEIGQKLVDQKGERAYIGKKRDLHEADIDHLKKAAEAYRYVAEKEGWTIIDCTENGQLLPIQTIHERIYQVINPLVRQA